MKRVEVLNKIRNDYDLVVEIGAGPIPYYGSNVIIDKFPYDNAERCDNIKLIAPLIKADASSLPFVKKSVDLLFISQVIEHLADPLFFLKEAKRVAKDIYIESPSIIRETIFGWSFHRWVIQVNDGKWIFYKNDLLQLCGSHFHNEHDIFFTEYTINNFEKLNNYYYGSVDKLEFEVSKTTALEHLSKVNHQKTDFPTNTNDITYSDKIIAISYLLFKNIMPNNIRDYIRRIKFAFKRSKYDSTIDFDRITKDKLMCIFCKEPLKDTDNPCSCGVSVKRLNGMLSFDADDY